MATTTVNCKEFWYIGHNNNTSNAESSTTGWHTWKKIAEQTAFDYAGPKGDTNGRLVCICFKADIPDGGTSYKINLKIPAIRQSGTAKSGTLFAKVYSADPTEKTSDGKKVKITKKEARNLIPTSTAKDGSASWSSTNLEEFYINITISSNKVKKDKWCYVVLGSDKLLQIGYKSTDGRKFSGTVEYYTAVGKGTVTITDNGDNTFSITGTKGTSGINNTASGPTLSWGYDTNYGKNVTNPNALEIKTPTNPTRTVYAKGVTKATYGANSEATTSLAIKQYVAPGAPGKPEIDYNKSRLTIKENWIYKWTAAEKVNDSSPVAGYRIRLYRNGSPIKGLKTTTASKQLTLGEDSTKDYVDTEKTSTEVIIDPTKFEFVPGDKVKLSVIAYSKNGKGTQLFGNNGYQTYSAESLVQNAGIIRVRVNGSWKEGQVYIRVNGVWKEADVIKIKTPTGWKESE